MQIALVIGCLLGKISIDERPGARPLHAPLEGTHHAIGIALGEPRLPAHHPFFVKFAHWLNFNSRLHLLRCIDTERPIIGLEMFFAAPVGATSLAAVSMKGRSSDAKRDLSFDFVPRSGSLGGADAARRTRGADVR